MTVAKRDGRTGRAASLGGDTPAITARSLRHSTPPQMAKVERRGYFETETRCCRAIYATAAISCVAPALITGPGTDQMQRAVIVAAAAGAPNGLAVDRHNLALDLARQGLCTAREAAFERPRIEQHEDPPERIVRRDTVRQGQEG